MKKQNSGASQKDRQKSEKKQKRPEHQIEISARRAEGKSLREKLSRKEHSSWAAHHHRRDPVAILEHSNAGRIPELIPLRYGRMMAGPFAFFRGSAALMAADLAKTGATGINVQSCGDCHLLNFGGFATPERNVIVDINDFDETLKAPWEWDLKRLATSFVLVCRNNGFKPEVGREAAAAVGRSYRNAMWQFAEMTAMDVWYSKMDLDKYLSKIKDKQFLKDAAMFVKKSKAKSQIENLLPKLTTSDEGKWAFKENPPLVYHSEDFHSPKFVDSIRRSFDAYKESMGEERRILMDRYELVDIAMKVVGIGSVGTRCGVILLMASENDPLILQVKEARTSVLEPYNEKYKYENHGQRVVVGQRVMQAHSDIFLGWTKGPKGNHYFVRQLRDMKMSPMPETWTAERSLEVAESFGWVLARAHARSGDPAIISGYMGTNADFDEALSQFAVAYADQTERDHDALVQAVKSGRLEANIER
jgi:uncharacterized protein (DUF2252 family)